MTNIVERNGRKYGYGSNTKPIREEQKEEYFDLAWLSARTEVNKRTQPQRERTRKNKREMLPAIIGVISMLLLMLGCFMAESYGLGIALVPFSLSFVLFRLIGWTSDYYRGDSDD